jgi:hypothetical protein
MQVSVSSWWKVWRACRSSGPEVLATCGLEVTPVADHTFSTGKSSVGSVGSGFAPLTKGFGPGANSGSDSFLSRRNFFLRIIFLQLNHRHIIFNLKNSILWKNFVLKFLICKHYFSLLNTFMRKGRNWIRIRIRTSDEWIRKAQKSCGSSNYKYKVSKSHHEVFFGGFYIIFFSNQ